MVTPAPSATQTPAAPRWRERLQALQGPLPPDLGPRRRGWRLSRAPSCPLASVVASVQVGSAVGVGNKVQERHSCVTTLPCTGHYFPSEPALHTPPDANKARKYWLNPHVKQPTVLGVFIDGLNAIDRFLVQADGLPNPPLPGVHLEDRLEPCSRADLSILEKEAPAGAILLDLIRPKSQIAQLIRAAPAMTS